MGTMVAKSKDLSLVKPARGLEEGCTKWRWLSHSIARTNIILPAIISVLRQQSKVAPGWMLKKSPVALPLLIICRRDTGMVLGIPVDPEVFNSNVVLPSIHSWQNLREDSI